MSQLNKYVTKNEIEEFLDNLKLEDYTKEHEQIKTFVLQYMLKNPPGSDRVVQVGTFGKTPGSVAHGQNADGLIISYVCPRLIPLVGDQLKQKQIEGHHVCCRYDGSAKQYVIQIQFNETAPEKEAEAILDLGSIATKVTEMGVSDFWASVFIYLTSQAGYTDGVRNPKIIDKLGGVTIAFGEHENLGALNTQKLEAFGQRMEWTLDETGGCFFLPRENVIEKEEAVQPQKETSAIEENKEQGEATKYGPALTVEEITNILLDLGVSQIDVKESFAGLPTKLAIDKLPNVTIHRVGNKVTLTYGNTEKAILLDKSSVLDENLPTSMRLSPEEIRYEVFDDVVNQSGLYIYTVSPKEETKMAYLPKTTIQILKPIYRDRLEKAGLSGEAIQLISDEIFHGSALKAPKEDSSFVVVAGKDVLNVYYSHDNKSVTLTDIETTKTTSSGEVVSYSTGTSCAFFVVDTSNTQEKLIVKHVGVPKVKLELSSGYSVNLPFKKTYETIDRDQVLVRITCDALLSLSSKVLQNLTGPALTDLQENEPARYFIGGLQLTEKVFRKRTGAGAGSWADIE